MNDVTRQVAGALGVAIVGSLVTSLYGSRVEDATAALPPESAQAASDSVGGAVAVAEQIPGEAGASLAQAATVAYTDALGLGLLAAAAASFVGVALVLRFLPARHKPAAAPYPVPVVAVEMRAAA